MNITYGSVFHFHYNDPKTKSRIKMWDARPLILPLWVDNKYVLGVNVHWLPGTMRIKFINRIIKITSSPKYNKKIAKITYDMIINDPTLNHAIIGVRKYLKNRIVNVTMIPKNRVGRAMLQNPKYYERKLKGGGYV